MFETVRRATEYELGGTGERPRGGGGKKYAIALSDAHIGNGAPTCWYQSRVHEPQLSALLAWILAGRQSIREIVLLGDVFEFWTYPPSVRPPSMRDIIAANPGMLGPRGPLAAVIRAFPNQVRLLPGNHDGTLARADIDQLNRSLGGNLSRGERIELVDSGQRVVTGASGKRTVFTHGHHPCMFNAPDARSKWNTIPIGHFVTRAISYQLSKTMSPGQTAADTRNSGNPSGVDLSGVVKAWNRRGDLAAFLIEYICKVTGLPPTLPIVMPDGSKTSAQEAARVYAGLFTLWANRLGRPLDAMRAASADWSGGDDLAFFAQRLAIQKACDLVVMGHTHSAVAGIDVSPVDYVNTGYVCVSRLDSARTPFTFAQVDLERAAARVLGVVPRASGFGVAPARARRLPSVIVRGRDYSCYPRVENRSDRPLRLVGSAKAPDSFWVVPPPDVIPPRSRGDVWLQDSPGATGSGGRFSYSDGLRTYEFAVSCPVTRSNSVTSPVPYETKVGGGSWRKGGVDPSGYPVQARFYVGASLPLRSPVPSKQHGPGTKAPVSRLQENPYILAAREILDRSKTPKERGIVLCVTYLKPYDSTPLFDPTTDSSGKRLLKPPAHLLSPEVHTTLPVGGTKYRYVWIQPHVPPVSPPLAGGIAFLPAAGQPWFTLVTFNVAGLDNDYKRRCTNGHHAEMQLVGFVNAQLPQWRGRLGTIELHNYSRKGPTWGYSACNPCLHDLADFVSALNRLPRPRRIKASISWERLYDKNRICGHPTDAANIRRLVGAGWDEPQGSRPPGTQFPTPTPTPTARPPGLPVYTA
jgi:UDP-2,3-diacylglucosamine pyrophosphatase LpxH